MTDVTPEDMVLIMRRTRCPLCRVHLSDDAGLATSKHVDHIIPICVGGTHTVANIRVICRTCNLKRPKDGSDVVGQVALWQAEPAFAPRERAPKHKPPRERIHCMPRAPKTKRTSKYEHLYPEIIAMLERGDRSKRIARHIGLSRDTVRTIVRRLERTGAA